MRQKYIEEIRNYFGMTYREATAYYNRNRHNKKLLDSIVKFSDYQAEKSFYND